MAARLRKTFHYPADNDDEDSSPEAIDEEEQDSLIHSLALKNASQNKTYTTLLLTIPLISLIPYLLTLPTGPLTLLSLLSITSLLSTTYLLRTLPAGTTNIALIDNSNLPALERGGVGSPSRAVLARGEGGPVVRYLPYLNLGLCAVLAVLGAVVGRTGVRGMWWGFEWLPGMVYAVVLGGEWVMGGVDVGGELGGLRYGYKGA